MFKGIVLSQGLTPGLDDGEDSDHVFPFTIEKVVMDVSLQGIRRGGITRNLAGAPILIALAKTIYEGKRRNVTRVDFETFRGAA